jgi:hypothetical protein
MERKDMRSNGTATLRLGTTGRIRTGPALILGAVGFVLLYFSADFVVPNLASSALPLPDASSTEARAWFAGNRLAAVMLGICQFLSVLALAVFVTRLSGIARLIRRPASTATRWGLAAVALMMLASVCMWLLAAVAPSASLGAVAALRTGNFIAGGTAHVLALGVFAVLASRTVGMSKPVRVLSYVAAVPAVLSVVSLVWFEGAVFILLGRLLCMVWTISAAVSVTRRLSKGSGVRGTVPAGISKEV